MTASVKNASMTTAVSPLKGKKPAANAEIPDAIDMFGCSMNAGTSEMLAGSMIRIVADSRNVKTTHDWNGDTNADTIVPVLLAS